MVTNFGLKASEIVQAIPYEQALNAAVDIMAMLGPYCDRVAIAGSVRRHKNFVKDIEILVAPKVTHSVVNLAGEKENVEGLTDALEGFIHLRNPPFVYRLNVRGSRTFGPTNKYLVKMPEKFAVDVFTSTLENWGTSLSIRTGPKEWNVRCMKRFMDLGLKGHISTGIELEDGERIMCRSEDEYFQLLKWDYVDPWDRFGGTPVEIDRRPRPVPFWKKPDEERL